MAWKQLRATNLDPIVYVDGKPLTDWYGWCLATVEAAFGMYQPFATAWLAWEGTEASLKHDDRNFPTGVYFPIWFSGYEGMGHVAIAYLNDTGQLNIWTSPYEHIPYFYSGYSSIEKLAAGYHVTYVGWSEGIGTTRLIAAEPEPTPAPASQPAPQPASASYTLIRTVPGYQTSNEAANHFGTSVDVPAGAYSIFNEANGMVNVTTTPGVAGAWINPADNHEPEPLAPVPPANITYTKLDKPLTLVAKLQPTHVWDLGFADDVHATSVATLDQGTPFVAVGRAQRTDGDRPAYFMDADSFGAADQTGIPAHNQGINTVDLSPAPAPQPTVIVVQTPETVNIPAPATGTTAVATSLKIVDNSGAPEAEPTPAPVRSPVAPAPTTPEGIVFTAFMNPVAYKVKEAMTVTDVTGTQPNVDLKAGTPVNIGGKFTYKGVLYFRAQSSIDKATWYGFPATSLVKMTSQEASTIFQDELHQLIAEVDAQEQQKALETVHQKAIQEAATVEGFLIRLLSVFHKH